MPKRVPANREVVVASEEVWFPNPGPQRAFVGCETKDACYGGARGGGKSIALLLAFREYAMEFGKDARGIIFRRTYTELEELIRKGQQYFVDQLGWDYNQTAHLFTCVSGRAAGATLRLAYLKNVEDARIYAGHEYPWQGFDELGNWPDPAPLDLLMGSMRAGKTASGKALPTYRRSTCMPGGPGHAWVKDRYVPDDPAVVRRVTPMPKERPDLSYESIFIPAKLEDNPKVDQKDYELNLAAIANPKLFEAWRRGDWRIIAGAFFDIWDEDLHVEFGEAKFQEWEPAWMSGDWGFRDDFVVGWHRQREDGTLMTVGELKMNNTPPTDAGRIIAKQTLFLGLPKQSLFALGPDAWATRHDAVKTIAEQLFEGIEMELLEQHADRKLIPFPHHADTDRHGGWMLLYQLMASGRWKAHHSCRELRTSIPMLQHDDKDSADVAESPKDHAPDMLRYGMKTFLNTAKVPKDEKLRRAIVEKVPQAAMREEEIAKLTDVERMTRANSIAWASRLLEKKKVLKFRRRQPVRARVGAA